MLKIFLAIAIMCAAVFVGPQLADTQGFVHIATNSYIVETSLTTAIIIAVVSFFILHFVFNFLGSSLRLPKVTAKWFSSRRSKKQQSLLQEAFLSYEEGAYSRALNLIRKSGSRKDLPASCQFLGAKCAFELGDLENCRNFLDLAERSEDGSVAACKILRAKLNLKLGNAEAAIENLDEIKHDNYTNAITTRLLVESYQATKSYDKLFELLPNIKKHKILADGEYLYLLKEVSEAKMQSFTTSDEVKAFIGSLDRSARNEPEIMACIIEKLVQVNEDELACKYALPLLRSTHSIQLLDSVARWPKSISKVEQELAKQASSEALGSQVNVPLLKALANLELQSGQIDAAKEHLKQALSVSKNKDLYVLAAKLNEKTAQHEEAAKFFSLALNTSSK